MAREKTRSRFKAWANHAARFVAIVLLSTFLVLSEDQRAAIAQALADPLAVLSGRSPGERSHAALRQTKVRHHAPLPKGEKLLSDARVLDEEDLAKEPGFFAENEQAPPVADLKLPNGGKQPGGPGPVLAHGGGGGNGGSKFFGGGGGGSGGGGGGGGRDGGGDPLCVDDEQCRAGPIIPTGDPIPPTVVGVPEPATWAMALTGFFVLGGLLRARRVRARSDTAASPEPQHD